MLLVSEIRYLSGMSLFGLHHDRHYQSKFYFLSTRFYKICFSNTQYIVPPKSNFERASIRSSSDNNGQPRNPPEPFQYTQQTNEHTARAITRSLSNTELDKMTVVAQGHK
jgi:hypothetical protein